jgi:hypothetical protein
MLEKSAGDVGDDGHEASTAVEVCIYVAVRDARPCDGGIESTSAARQGL